MHLCIVQLEALAEQPAPELVLVNVPILVFVHAADHD